MALFQKNLLISLLSLSLLWGPQAFALHTNEECIALRTSYNQGASTSAQQTPREVELKNALAECFAAQWEQFFKLLVFKAPRAIPSYDLSRKLLAVRQEILHEKSRNYLQLVDLLHGQFPLLLPLQSQENSIGNNPNPNSHLSSGDRETARELYSFFQYNFDFPSEIVRFSTFLRAEMHFRNPGLDQSHYPDFSRLLAMLVTMGRFAPKFYRIYQHSVDSPNGGCGQISSFFRDIMVEHGLNAELYTVQGLKTGGGHTIFGINYAGQYYYIDPTIAQYSKFNLPCIVTPEIFFADIADKRAHNFSHFGLEGYLDIYRRSVIPQPNSSSYKGSILTYDCQSKTKEIAHLMALFEESVKSGDQYDWAAEIAKIAPNTVDRRHHHGDLGSEPADPPLIAAVKTSDLERIRDLTQHLSHEKFYEALSIMTAYKYGPNHSAIYLAITANNRKVCSYFLERITKEQLNNFIFSPKNQSAIFSVATGGDFDIFKMILNKYSRDEKYRVLKFARGPYGMTILGILAEGGDPEKIAFLGSQVEQSMFTELASIKNEQGHSAVSLAIKHASIAQLKVLVAYLSPEFLEHEESLQPVGEIRQLFTAEIAKRKHAAKPAESINF